MATLLPSLSSDEEDNVLQNESDDEDDNADEVNHDFSFGGILVRFVTLHCASFFSTNPLTLPLDLFYCCDLLIGFREKMVVEDLL